MFDASLYVREIQEYLRYLSFYNPLLIEINVDGIYGPETEQAVRLFQRSHRMEETGRVNRPTWDMICAEYEAALKQPTPPRSQADSPQASSPSTGRVG